MKSNHFSRRTGFTLIELLVVVAIIIVLIFILLPALGSARAQAKEVACLSNLRQIGVGIRMYADENDGYTPVLFVEGSVAQSTGGDTTKYGWFCNLLTAQLGESPKVWNCPAQPMNRWLRLTTDPAKPWTSDMKYAVGSYAYNGKFAAKGPPQTSYKLQKLMADPSPFARDQIVLIEGRGIYYYDVSMATLPKYAYLDSRIHNNSRNCGLILDGRAEAASTSNIQRYYDVNALPRDQYYFGP